LLLQLENLTAQRQPRRFGFDSTVKINIVANLPASGGVFRSELFYSFEQEMMAREGTDGVYVDYVLSAVEELKLSIKFYEIV
jgi:hypothetical protein